MKFILAAFLLVIASSVAHERGTDNYHVGLNLPPYLAHVNKEAYSEFLKIAHDGSLTIAQQKEELERWAKKNRILAKVEKYNAENEKSMKKVRRDVAKLIKESLPVVLKKYISISEDQNQTLRQAQAKLEELAAKHPKAFNVLTFAMGQFMIPHEGKSSPLTEGRDRRGHEKVMNGNGNHSHRHGTRGQDRRDWWE